MLLRGFSSVLSKNNVTFIRFLQPVNGFQAATITAKSTQAEAIQRPPPFPYDKKKLRYHHRLFDSVLKRFNENTKLIVVEGNIGAGKSALAKSLADELDMVHVPEANIDDYYKNEYGKSLREYNHMLSEGARSFHMEDYYKNPNHKSVPIMQLRMYDIRYNQYIDALCHILNTGQGVVLERCVYSDIVFMETMRKLDYLSKGVQSYYYDMINNTLPNLMRPHLVIYLDVPVNVIMERIKKRNIGYEVQSKVLTKEYLTTLEDEYRKYLNRISEHAELLVYDWSTFGDVEVVVEDIERVDFDKYDKYDENLIDWRLDNKELQDKRFLFTNSKYYLNRLLLVPRFDVPDVYLSPDDSLELYNLWHQIPGNKFIYGYNAEVGDKNLLFKSKVPIR